MASLSILPTIELPLLLLLLSSLIFVFSLFSPPNSFNPRLPLFFFYITKYSISCGYTTARTIEFTSSYVQFVIVILIINRSSPPLTFSLFRYTGTLNTCVFVLQWFTSIAYVQRASIRILKRTSCVQCMYPCMYVCTHVWLCVYVCACTRCFLDLRTIDYTLYITLFLCTLKLDSKLHYVRDGLIKETRREKNLILNGCVIVLFFLPSLSLSFCSLGYR